MIILSIPRVGSSRGLTLLFRRTVFFLLRARSLQMNHVFFPVFDETITLKTKMMIIFA